MIWETIMAGIKKKTHKDLLYIMLFKSFKILVFPTAWKKSRVLSVQKKGTFDAWNPHKRALLLEQTFQLWVR